MADEWRNLYVIDVGEDSDSGKLIMSRIECVIEGPSWPFRSFKYDICSSNEYLVESCGALLLVSGTISGKSSWEGKMSAIKTVRIEFKVFEANLQPSWWVEMRSMGDDQVLFLGPRCSQSVCVSQYNLNGNCIFFLDDGNCNWYWKDVPSSYAMYDMSDGMVRSPLPKGSCKGEKAPATWLFPRG